MNKSEMMRMMLIQNAGIVLDDEPRRARAQPPAPAPPPPIDRAEIRTLLTERGAKPSDLDWLTASCPSLEHARNFTPPEFPHERDARERAQHDESEGDDREPSAESGEAGARGDDEGATEGG